MDLQWMFNNMIASIPEQSETIQNSDILEFQHSNLRTVFLHMSFMLPQKPY